MDICTVNQLRVDGGRQHDWYCIVLYCRSIRLWNKLTDMCVAVQWVQMHRTARN